MKNILILFSFLTMSFMSSAQNGVYMLTEVWKQDYSTTALIYDSVYVTNPSGVTVGYSIPLFTANVSAHNSQLNIIINGITSQGYKIVTRDWENGVTTSVTTSSTFYKTIFFAQPWTTAGLIPAGVNNSLIKITNVFPNPTSNVVNLKFASSSNNSKLYLIHSGGYIINEYDVSNLTDFSVNTSLLSNGNYLFVLVSNGIYSESKSLMKQ